MDTFPRSRNGYRDNGQTISALDERCPNCGSSQYRQTISVEECSACGLRCDYWGEGANKVYTDMMARRHREKEKEDFLAGLQIQLDEGQGTNTTQC